MFGERTVGAHLDAGRGGSHHCDGTSGPDGGPTSERLDRGVEEVGRDRAVVRSMQGGDLVTPSRVIGEGDRPALREAGDLSAPRDASRPELAWLDDVVGTSKVRARRLESFFARRRAGGRELAGTDGAPSAPGRARIVQRL